MVEAMQQLSDDAIIRELVHLGHVVSRRSRQRESGHSSKDLVLASLATHDTAVAEGLANRPLTQVELADILGTRPQSIGSLLADMEQEGLVVRSVSENDRRAFYVRLTEAGATRAQAVRIARRRAAEEMLSCLTPHEKEALASAILKLNAALR